MIEEIQDQLNKVIATHRDIYIRSGTERVPQNCVYNEEALVGVNGFCIKTRICSLQDSTVQSICENVNTAIRCPSFTKHKTVPELIAEYEEILSDSDQLSVLYPEIMALKWVLSKTNHTPQEVTRQSFWKRLLGLI